ncbi:MAG: APC family permease [Haloarculaceae archaeon]
MSTDSSGDGRFDRRLGLADCVLLSVGGMVGSAIFVFPGSTGRLTGPSAVLAWVCAGVLMSAIALCYTELTLAFPKAGAPAVFPYEAFGTDPRLQSFASYLEGVGYSFGWVFGITVSALAVGDYLGVLFPGAGGYTVPLALLAVALAGTVNLLGVRITTRTNLVLSAVLLASLASFVAAGLGQVRPTAYRPFFTGGAPSFLAAVQIATTAYGAWTVVPAAIEEVRDPARTAPRAILLSLTVVVTVYAAVVATLHGIVPTAEFTTGSQVMTTPLGVAVMRLGLPWLRYVLAAGAVVAIFTTMLVGVLSAGRVLFALGDNGTLPRAFAARHEGTDVPWVGVATVTGAAGALALFPGYFYQLLVVSSVLGTGLPYAINLLSFLGYRRYRDDVSSAFRVPGGYGVPVLAFLALGVAMIGLGATEVLWSTTALLLLTGYYAVQSVATSRLSLSPR